jgi:hypothetical protein
VRFNLDDYDTVESRIGKFWTDHPEGRILTELVHRDDKQYIVRADIYTDRQDTRPAATGMAEEVVGSTPVNKTSALENCETSAVGRGLANLNYAAKARPSQTEMEKASRVAAVRSAADQARAALKELCAKHNLDLARVAAVYQQQHGESLKQTTDPDRIAAFTAALAKDPEHVLGIAA